MRWAKVGATGLERPLPLLLHCTLLGGALLCTWTATAASAPRAVVALQVLVKRTRVTPRHSSSYHG